MTGPPEHVGSLTDAAPPGVSGLTERQGSQLEQPIRGQMEHWFGADFSRVRVHTDMAAERSAEALRAAAYTIGQDIVFGAGKYAPESAAGARLLTHELTHIVQQASASPPHALDDGARALPQDQVEREADAVASSVADPTTIGGRLGRSDIARQALDQYETKGIEITGGEIAKLVGESYWENKVGGAYKLLYGEGVAARFKADAEERDAVLSVLWSVRPAKLTTGAVNWVEIPPRPGRPSSALIYEFTFTPKSKPAEKDAVEVNFKNEGKAAAVIPAGPAPAGYKPSYLSMDSENFPESRDEYWKQHPQEQAQLYHWIESLPDGGVDQIVTTEETTTARKKIITHTSAYHVKGAKKGGKLLPGFSADYLGAAPTVREPAAGYAEKDRADLLLETAQSGAESKKAKLGKVNGLDKLPSGERLSVKYAIWQYFEGGTRNAEVDVVLPIEDTGRTVLYTLRFRASNDVDIERVGEKGTGTGQLDPTNLDIHSVRDYTANSKDPPTLLSWLKRRYKAVSPTGKTVEAICNNFNAKLRAQAGKAEWFKDNYGIHVLPASDGATRLETEHDVPPDLAADVTNFTPAELKVVEITLETFSDDLLALVSGTRMVRKGMGIRFDEKARTFAEEETAAGLTLQKDGTRTIVIFDRAAQGDLALFVGGREGVRPPSTMTVAHEFGHVIEESSGIKKAFYERFGTKAKPPTWYAARHSKTELFTEMFALYQTDPQWLKTNRPDVFNWLETLSTTGKPPHPSTSR